MASERDVRARLAELGVTNFQLGMNGNTYELDAVSPKGTNFRASSCHARVISYYTNFPEARDAMMEDLASGLEACMTKDCEYCTE